MHHGVVVLHGGDSVGHRRIMRVDLKDGFDLNQMWWRMPIRISPKPYAIQHLLYLDLVHAYDTGG